MVSTSRLLLFYVSFVAEHAVADKEAHAITDVEVTRLKFLAKAFATAVPMRGYSRPADANIGNVIPLISKDSAKANLFALQAEVTKLQEESNDMKVMFERLQSRTDKRLQAPKQKPGATQPDVMFGLGVLGVGAGTLVALLRTLDRVWSRHRVRVPVMNMSAAGGAEVQTTDSEVLGAVALALAKLPLTADKSERVLEYVRLLLEYNERTNVFSKGAYDKLPFHVADSVTLALRVGKEASQGVLDLGSGSGLPSLIIACVNPMLPVWAVESKSRKTRFLAQAAKELQLDQYGVLTQNVHEISRAWYFDCDVVTAKAFKPLKEVGPIARRCIGGRARLLVPISESQAREFSLREEQLCRDADFLYYSEEIEASKTAPRALVTLEDARAYRL